MLSPGDSLAGFVIMDVLGEGGMGVVYKAMQVSLDRVIALKVLAPDLVKDTEDVNRFRLESRAAANLKHPSIVEVYDAGEADGLYYFAMAYIDGGSIATWMQNLASIPVKETLVVAQCVASALEYAWDTAKLIHRDIKPENILVDSHGEIKLVDLGVIKLAGATGNTETAHDTIYGTPYYCSPEQAKGEKLDCRADIYSLGAMMYHMLTGVLPFGETPGTGALVKHVTEYLPDPRALNRKVSAGAAVLVARMMAKDPDQRYADWSGVISDIKKVMHGKLPLNPLPAGSTVSTVKLEPRRATDKSARKVVIKKSPGAAQVEPPKAGGKISIKAGIKERAGEGPPSVRAATQQARTRLRQKAVQSGESPTLPLLIALIIIIAVTIIVVIGFVSAQG